MLDRRSYHEHSALISSDMEELLLAAKKLASHSLMLGGFATSLLEWIASFAAMYVFIC